MTHPEDDILTIDTLPLHVSPSLYYSCFKAHAHAPFPCRPAAIEQLIKVGERIGVPVFDMGTDALPADIAKRGLEKALAEGYDAVIVDTAGRLQV